MTRRLSAAALAAAALAAVVLWALGRPMQGVGLLVGAFLSSLNLMATGLFVERVRLAEETRRRREAEGMPAPDPMEEERRRTAEGNRAAASFIIRYLLLGLVLVVLILIFDLPPATTVFGLAAVPLTIYVWQIGRVLTGRWRAPMA